MKFPILFRNFISGGARSHSTASASHHEREEENKTLENNLN